MPSDQSTWLIAVPQNGDSEGLLPELQSKLSQQSKSHSPNSVAEFAIPSFKTGTLDLLISLSEDLPKQDTFFTNTVAKTVETLRNLLNNDASKLAQHILVNEKPVDDYLLKNWKWNDGRYGVQKGLKEMVDTLNKEMSSIDNSMRAKLTNYNLVKGSLVQMQRKKTGNLSVRSLVDVVSKDDFIQDSEYMETLLVAVPKSLVKDWNSKYERMGKNVVPRSSKSIASDDEYTLFSVIVFKRFHDDFAQACRENKFILRDFVYSDEEIAKQKQELEMADTTEKELWTELLHLSRTNFSESFQILVHLKVIRLFVESVLRYGLPANYTGVVVKPDPKSVKKTFGVLQSYFSYLGSSSKRANSKGGENEEFVGEYQTLMEQEFYDFVLFEVPWVVTQ
ncbi:Vacuolar ATP synthase subunit C [Stygiomarasmius scandens]|uniref:V-type proton ATPase subunit C n=1 Tax=Marasmiellus scandens TaxID=2682957 RepID=A0ABR1JSL6_9AGAR